MSNDLDIRLGTMADLEWMSTAAADAFAEDDLWNYLLRLDRRHRVSAFHRGMLAANVRRGHVTVIGTDGWAVWIPPTTGHQHEQLRLSEAWQAVNAFGLRAALRARQLRSKLAELRATMPPAHWYLDTVVVAPSSQGRGIGSRLVRHTMDRAAQERSGCYLEATGIRNRELYARLGYVPVETVTFGSALTVTGMWADPVNS